LQGENWKRRVRSLVVTGMLRRFKSMGSTGKSSACPARSDRLLL